ncbi:hypothetical protein PUN28_014850 [Cardiocondyla obscurior]|uniref:Uncharacterized protein n=1 Tax=Cardiocondyla obscurior TaxID=286306 RepID=A0AAW2F1T1_9HYME
MPSHRARARHAYGPLLGRWRRHDGRNNAESRNDANTAPASPDKSSDNAIDNRTRPGCGISLTRSSLLKIIKCKTVFFYIKETKVYDRSQSALFVTSSKIKKELVMCHNKKEKRNKKGATVASYS